MSAKLVYPGRFIRTTPMIGAWSKNSADPACVLCRRASCAAAWMHLDLHVFVCDRCMVDPSENGDRIADRVLRCVRIRPSTSS